MSMVWTSNGPLYQEAGDSPRLSFGTAESGQNGSHLYETRVCPLQSHSP